MTIATMKRMFREMVEGKNASLIPTFYHPDFELHTNGQVWDYARFLQSHQEVYQTSIQYSVSYDEETLCESGNRLAGRVFITTSRPDEPPKEIEVVLIAQFKEGKFYRLWELTYPDWSQLEAFNKM
jgi:hypothetical protein